MFCILNFPGNHGAQEDMRIARNDFNANFEKQNCAHCDFLTCKFVALSILVKTHTENLGRRYNSLSYRVNIRNKQEHMIKAGHVPTFSSRSVNG